MQNGQVVYAVLAGLMVGVLVPLVVQLFLTLRRLSQLVAHADELVVATRPSIEWTLKEVGATAAHLNRAGLVLERSEDRISEMLQAVDSLKQWLGRLKSVATVLTVLATTVLPAALDALKRSGAHATPELEKTNNLEKGLEKEMPS